MKKMLCYKEKYSNIVSIGCMCSTALYLRSIGVRSCSSFFDWVDGNLKNNIELIENSFSNLFDRDLLVQKFDGCPHIVTNTKYGISFVHLFDPKKTFDKQYSKIKKETDKRIQNFYDSLKNNCLLVYYCRNKEEAKWIKNNQELLVNFCLKHQCNFIFIFNDKTIKLESFKSFVIPANNIHIPFGGPVSYLFEETSELDEFLISHYDPEKRKQNLAYHPRKHIIRHIKAKLSKHRKDKLVL